MICINAASSDDTTGRAMERRLNGMLGTLIHLQSRMVQRCSMITCAPRSGSTVSRNSPRHVSRVDGRRTVGDGAGSNTALFDFRFVRPNRALAESDCGRPHSGNAMLLRSPGRGHKMEANDWRFRNGLSECERLDSAHFDGDTDTAFTSSDAGTDVGVYSGIQRCRSRRTSLSEGTRCCISHGSNSSMR